LTSDEVPDKLDLRTSALGDNIAQEAEFARSYALC
jgi:hypothetical protein